MPHFGLMDEGKLGPVAGPLQRARLHLRGGKRRLKQGKIAAGIVTLYDAVCAAMESYAAQPKQTARLAIMPGDDLKDDKILFSVLVRSGVIRSGFSFEMFDRLMETALHHDLPGYDYRGLLDRIEDVMNELGVTPFDESSLPSEDPATF